MKYNPKINEKVAGLPGFAGRPSLAPADTVQGNLEVLRLDGGLPLRDHRASTRSPSSPRPAPRAS